MPANRSMRRPVRSAQATIGAAPISATSARGVTPEIARNSPMRCA